MGKKRPAVDDNNPTFVTLYRFDEYLPTGKIAGKNSKLSLSSLSSGHPADSRTTRERGDDITVMREFLKKVLLRFSTHNDKAVYGATPSKHARQTIIDTFNGCEFEIFCRHDPTTLESLRPRDLVLVISDGTMRNHNMPWIEVPKKRLTDRVLLPWDEERERLYIPWHAVSRDLLLPVNFKENNFSDMHRSARALIGTINVMRSVGHDSAEHTRAADSIQECGVRLGHDNRRRRQDRAARKKKPRYRFIEAIREGRLKPQWHPNIR